jgi:hypothetical protein
MSQTITIAGMATSRARTRPRWQRVTTRRAITWACAAASAARAPTKGLAKGLKNVPVAGGVLKGPKATEGAVGSGLGFTITATVKGGSYPTVGHGATIKTAQANTVNNANLLGGCKSGNVTHIDIDSSQSSAVL